MHGERRGSALILTLVLTLGLASLATSAIYLGSNARLLTDSSDRERDLRYAAESMLAMGKSTLNYDPLALPDTGLYRTVAANVAVNGADGLPVPGVTASMYIGRTSSNTGQFGSFVSVVAVARNSLGAQVVRRLELAQESFAKFSYWSNQESNNGQPIYFNNNDQIWGPVWSNDVINIGSLGAHFHGDVGTAMSITDPGYATFDKGYSVGQKRIELPLPSKLAFLADFADAGNFKFTNVPSGSIDQTMMRIEFVAKDLNRDGKLDGVDEGFFRVYVGAPGVSPKWVRGDFTWDNCGAFYMFGLVTDNPNDSVFVPLSEHQRSWFARGLSASGLYSPSDSVNLTTNDSTNKLQIYVMQQPSARCYMGGDPHLHAVNIRSTIRYKADTTFSPRPGNGNRNRNIRNAIQAAQFLGGSDTTFDQDPRDAGSMGAWTIWPGGVNRAVQNASPSDAKYLFPLSRTFNPGTKGVIYVDGTVGISGTLRGRVTLYAAGNVAVLDDMAYATDPSLNLCHDILGVISANNIMLADNAMNDPPAIDSLTGSPVLIGAATFRNMGDTPYVVLDGVMMALNTAFGAENYSEGAYNAHSPYNDPKTANNGNGCDGLPSGRGCLLLTGGVIQQQRGPVGVNYGDTWFTGYTKRYSYDRCALYNPPPYFPTTGRYTDNRYYELDPSGFDVATLFRTLTPH